MAGEFTRIDRGLNRIRIALGRLPKGRVLVGWPGHGPMHQEVTHEKGTNGRKTSKIGDQASKMTIAQIAVIHEFGAPAAGIPARPVMKQTNLKYQSHLAPLQARLLQQIYRGTLTPEQALKQMGVYWEGRIKVMFREGQFKALDPKTVRAKGSSKPLIDSGQLRNSVTSRVVRG